MPLINEAMIASRTQSIWTRTQPLMGRASSITSSVSSVKNTFSSWDNCMKESYCKWPVIAAIVIVSLIVFSVVWCIVRCACCGLSCCCTCFSCLKCCGDCCGMCDGRKDKGHKHIDEPFRPQPFQPTPSTGYRAPAPMAYEAPKFAQFETGKNGLAVEPPKSIVHEDALPPMPSWDGASTKRIPTAEQKEEGMEMGNLTPDGQSIPLMSGGAHTPGPTSPINDASSGYFGGRGAPGQNGYMQGQPGGMSRTGSSAMMNGRGGMGGPGYGGPNNRGDMAMGGPPRGQFNQSPGPQGYNNQRPGFPPTAGYRGPPQRQYSNDSGSPYGRVPQPQRQYSNDAPYPNGGLQRQFSGNNGFPQPGPQRQYSNDSYRPSQDIYRPPASPSSPLNNSGGFDFNLGGSSNYEVPAQQQSRYELPEQRSNYAPSTTAPPSYATRAPPPQQQQQQRQYSPSPNNERSYSPPTQHEMPSSEQIASRPDGGPSYPGYKPYSSEAARHTPPPPSALMPGRPNY